MAQRPKLHFLSDNNVPDSVGRYLRGRGHSVVRICHWLSAESPDPIVAEAAMRSGRILISWDKDFNAQRFLAPRYALLSRLAFSCRPDIAVERLKQEIDLIEREWLSATTRRAGRMIVHIGRQDIRIRR